MQTLPNTQYKTCQRACLVMFIMLFMLSACVVECFLTVNITYSISTLVGNDDNSKTMDGLPGVGTYVDGPTGLFWQNGVLFYAGKFLVACCVKI